MGDKGGAFLKMIIQRLSNRYATMRLIPFQTFPGWYKYKTG